MDRADLVSRIDHTVLGPTTTFADVRGVLDEALGYGTNACVPPCYVADAAEYAPDVSLVSVVGFPHGQNATAAKREEAVVAWEDGAGELDVTLNIGRLSAGETEAVTRDVEEVVAAVPIPVKVIVETSLLTEGEKRRACEAAVDAGAAFVKTSTGFASGGATAEDVSLLSEYLPVKAAGGIKTWEDAEVEAGAERIGTSRGVEIVEGFEAVRES